MAFCQALEDLAQVEVPIRGRHLRTIICELERLHSHQLWMGLAGHFIGYNTVFMWCWKYREPVLDICEELTGNRNHYENFRLGGCRRDIPQERLPEIRRRVDELEPPVQMLLDAVIDDPIIHLRTKGIGILTTEDAIRWAVAGPTARKSNVPIDVRADEPYASYDLIDWNVITWESCDVFAQVAVRLVETIESIKIIRQALEQMEPGPICTEVRELPCGEGIGHAEAPRGETFHYVASDGTNYPLRYKVRAPTYMNLPSFKAAVIGAELADAMLIVAAMDPCYSCTERMAVVDVSSKKRKVVDQRELMRLCWEKTKRLQKESGMKSRILSGKALKLE